MNTTTATDSLNALQAQYIEDTAGIRSVVLPQKVVEALLDEKGSNLHSAMQKRQLLSEELEKESKAVKESSLEVLQEFESLR
jgi:hypothetical protein